MKMKNLMIFVSALIVAGLVFGIIMFFTKNALQEAAKNQKVDDVSQDSAQIEKDIEEIPVEYILMQVNTDSEKSYVCNGFLFDKHGVRHYFDLTGKADLPAESIYEEAVRQSEFYEPEEYIYPGDIKLIYGQISSIDPENPVNETDTGTLAETKTFYAILSDGVKTYPVPIFSEGQKIISSSDPNAQNVEVFIRNLLKSKASDSGYIPVPTDIFKASAENDGNEDSEESEESRSDESTSDKSKSDESKADNSKTEEIAENITVE